MLGLNRSKNKPTNYLDSVAEYVKRNRISKWRDYEKSEHEVKAPPKKRKGKIRHSFPHLLNKQYKVPKYKYRTFFTTEVPAMPGNFEKSAWRKEKT